MDIKKIKEFFQGILGLLLIGFIVWIFIPGKEKESAWETAEKNNKVFSDKTKIKVSRNLDLGYPKLDEETLVKAVGLPLVKRYTLDDGYGLKFRNEGQPTFILEFRTKRINVGWDNFYDDPIKHGSINKENVVIAQRVLDAALGIEVSKDAINFYRDLQPVSIETLMHEVYVSPSRGYTLITISDQ
jgi:hypothetical protein